MYRASAAALPFIGWTVGPAAVTVSPFADTAVAAPLPEAALSTSVLVIRPAGPVPGTLARSTPSTAAARAATGEALTPSSDCAGEPGADGVVAGGGACPEGELPPLAPVAGLEAPSAIRAITWPTVTVSPSGINISLTVPLAGEGSSRSTLSVEISTIVSSALMKSPTLTCHSRIVPSLTDSPAAGVTTSIVCCAVVSVAMSTFTLARRVANSSVIRCGCLGCAPALLAHELVASDERTEPAENGHGDADAQRNPTPAHGRDACQRHHDPQDPVGPAEHQRGTGKARNGTHDQAQVDDRVKERRPLQACERQWPGAGSHRDSRARGDGRARGDSRARGDGRGRGGLGAWRCAHVRGRAHSDSQRAIRGNVSPASGGHCSIASGHHANASCSSSGTTVSSAPSASHACPTNITSCWGSRTSASARTRSGETAHSSLSSRTSVSAGFSPRSTAPPAPRAQRPAQEETHPARRPASQRPSAERVTHRAATL